jgi:hypothetical protein
VSAAPISDRCLDLGAGDAMRIGLYVGKGISRRCRRRRSCGKEPACNQASPDRFTIAVTMACRIVQGSHYSRASLIGRQRLSLNRARQQHQYDNAIDAHVGHNAITSNAELMPQAVDNLITISTDGHFQGNAALTGCTRRSSR